MARDEGVLVSINSDAHSTMEFDNLRLGVGQARGWLEPAVVLKTRALDELRPLLAATMVQGASVPARAAKAGKAGIQGVHLNAEALVSRLRGNDGSMNACHGHSEQITSSGIAGNLTLAGP